MALNKCWCPKHFACAKCGNELINMGFVELNGQIYCERDYEQNYAPKCAKCSIAIMGVSIILYLERSLFLHYGLSTCTTD